MNANSILSLFTAVIAINAIEYDDPKDINDVFTLKIQTASLNQSPRIYGNLRNQLKIAVLVKAVNNQSHTLHFADTTWKQMISLIFAENETKLNRDGNNGWCFTDVPNDFDREILFVRPSYELDVTNDGDKLLIFYVYTDQIEIRRIAVSLDNGYGKYFSTADDYDKQMSVTVSSYRPITYRRKDLTIEATCELGKSRAVAHCEEAGYPHTREYDCHYDNYYITVQNGIKKANISGYGVQSYQIVDFNQHMIAAHPFGDNGTQKFGFKNSFDQQELFPPDFHHFICRFDLFQSVIHSECNDAIIFTQMFFATKDVFTLHGDYKADIYSFDHDLWFELYDIYGNYGQFTVSFTEDKKYIEIKDRS